MFSGIVEESAEVVSLSQEKFPYRLVINCATAAEDARIGDSLCVSGVCLTVVERKGSRLHFDMVQETVRRTTLGRLTVGDRVNVERSLKVGDRIHGHHVYGHVDATARLRAKYSTGENAVKMVFAACSTLLESLVAKGSVAVNGVSLTVGEVSHDSFSVYLVPHTLAVTNLATLRIGGLVNIEIDMLARYLGQQYSGRRSKLLTESAERSGALEGEFGGTDSVRAN